MLGDCSPAGSLTLQFLSFLGFAGEKEDHFAEGRDQHERKDPAQIAKHKLRRTVSGSVGFRADENEGSSGSPNVLGVSLLLSGLFPFSYRLITASHSAILDLNYPRSSYPQLSSALPGPELPKETITWFYSPEALI